MPEDEHEEDGEADNEVETADEPAGGTQGRAELAADADAADKT